LAAFQDEEVLVKARSPENEQAKKNKQSVSLDHESMCWLRRNKTKEKENGKRNGQTVSEENEPPDTITSTS
jgi:hypothetical protein